MKLKHYLYVPLCGACALFAMAGCADEDLGKPDGGKPQGNGIVFGASASYVGDEPGKRTIYGDYDNPDNPTSQEILWVDRDRVEIYSPTSPTKKQVEYEVTNLDENDKGTAYLVSYQGQDGLQWDRSAPGQKQDFYAVYPSKASMTNQGIANQYVSFENGVLKGFIPTNQQQVISKSTGNWVATPNMDWQYMAARINGYEVPAEGIDGDISLVFKPLVTTLEVTLVGPSSPLAQMNIEAPEGVTIMGRFSCDLTQGNWDNESGVPTCVAEQTGTTTNYVTVNLYDDNNQPLQLADGEEITFNVFLLPVEDLTDISIRIAGFNTASRTMFLEDAQQGKVKLEPNKKTRVRVKAPNIGKETNKWIGGLNDNVLLTQLSIPGTANSFSYNYQDENYERWRTQTATIQEQWDAGIRCFELVCDENGGDVENAPLRCNRKAIGGGNEGISTFGQAVQKIWDLVQANSTEFAIIIPSYDSNTGHPSDHNGVAKFASGLNNFYNIHTEYEYRTFTRELTVGEARGSLIFIARITSEEDEGYTLPAPLQGTFVDEWGSLKDNWARRGYAVNGTRVNNWATGGNDTESVEYYMHTRTTQNYGTNQDNTAPQPEGFSLVGAPTLSTDFVHTSQRSGSSVQGRAYIQDWQRVVPRAGTYGSFTLRPGSFYLGSETEWNWGFETYYHYYYWPESLTEKEGHIWDTFEASILENSQEGGGEMFYINSLDGFFVDPDIENSYKPYVAGGTWGVGLSNGGTEGNILAYANHINDYFYNRILNYGVTNIYGPMNIVLMDYVYDGTAGGDRLPSTIINNNFRFPLLTSDGSTETPTPSTQADASFANGGSVWQ